MPRLPAFLFVAALALLVAAVAAGCGDGEGELTLEEYFRQFVATQNDAEKQSEALEDPSDQDFASETEQIEAWRAFIAAGLANLREFGDAYNGIDPPGEVEHLHNEVVAAVTDGIEVEEGIRDELGDVESTSELEAVLERPRPEFTEISERVTEACFALQAVADDSGIDVDLDCEDEE